MQKIKPFALYIAWVIALIATLSSLTLSEVFQYTPCHLCWYQRACLFPLVIILGIGAYTEDKKVKLYVIPLAALGAFIALYQLFLLVPSDRFDCAGGCHALFLGNFYLSLFVPLLSFFAFILIAYLSSIQKPS